MASTSVIRLPRGAAHPALLIVATFLMTGAILCFVAGIRPHRIGVRRATCARSGRLVWVSHGWLHSCPIAPDGTLSAYASEWICRVPPPWIERMPLSRERQCDTRVVASAAGNRVAIWYVDTGEPGPYGNPDPCIWLLDGPSSAPQPRRIASGTEPRFSPNGRYLAFEESDPPGLQPHNWWVTALDFATGDRRKLDGVESPFWASNGRDIAVVTGCVGDEGEFEIVDSKTGAIRLSIKGVNPMDPILSPDGRYLATHFHLSRPLTGHGIFDLRRHDFVRIDYASLGYGPGTLYSWSPDGRWMLWDWPSVDPRNDGCARRWDIGVTSTDGRTKRLIGACDPRMHVDDAAVFSPDSRHVLWLQPCPPAGKPNEAKDMYALMWRSVDGGEAKLLIGNVEAFAVTPANDEGPL